MDIRTFRAKTFPEALATLRAELGPEAEILHARELEKPAMLGLFGKNRLVEITAATRPMQNFDENRLIRAVENLEYGGPLRAFAGDSCKTIAIIGPNGAGKTSMISKLAIVHRHRSIGMISVDTHRPGANRVLLEFAEALNFSCEVVIDIPGMYRAAAKFSGCDFVFIDTPGIPRGDEKAMHELCEFLDVAMVNEVHLLLPSNGSAAFLRSTLRRFERLRPTGLSFSKFDELDDLSDLVPVLESCELPLRYVSTGPSLSKEIAVAAPEFFRKTLTSSKIPAA